MIGKVLITGGCGFIGSNLIRRMAAQGRPVQLIVLDNETMGTPKDLPQGLFTYERGDVRDLSTVARLSAGCDAIIHLAAQTRVMDSITNPESDFEINVRGTLNVLTAARDAGVRHVTLASTGGALFGDVAPIDETMLPQPLSPYGASKLATEAYAQAFAGSYGLRSTVLRFTNVYGPYSHRKGSAVAHFFRQIIACQPITIFGDGNQVRDFVFIDDLCDGLLQALDGSATGVFHLGSGRPTSIATLIDSIRRVVGPEWPVDVRHAPRRTGEVLRTYTNISKAMQAFDYRPKVTLEAGLLQTWRWFLSR